MSGKQTKCSYFWALFLLLPFAAHGFSFDPDGDGTGKSAIEIDAFDILYSSILSKNGVAAVVSTGLGGKITSYNHGVVATLTLNGQPVMVPSLDPNFDCELTIVLGLGTEITGLTADTVATAKDPNGSVNFFEMWHGPTCDTNHLAGTGFNNGTLIMSGTFDFFSSTFTATEKVNLVDLDKSPNGNQWNGISTVEGRGNASNAIITVSSFNDRYFTDLNSGDTITLYLQNYSQDLPYISTDPAQSYTGGTGGEGVAPIVLPDIGIKNGITGPDIMAQTDANMSLRSQPVLTPGACRMTGGNATVSPIIGTDGLDTWTYNFETTATEEGFETGYWVTTGGQINAPSGNQPVSGHWEHTAHGGANGNFSFHAGTSSAPNGTEISTVECADPGWCVQARCAPYKQLFWTGIGNFANQHFAGVFPGCSVVKGNNGTQHFVRVMIGDFGENDSPVRKEAFLPDADPANCDWLDKVKAAGYAGPPGPFNAADAVFLDSAPDEHFGYKGGQVCDKCPDYYQIEIHCDTDPGSDVIYEFQGYLQHGNYQIHPETGEQCPATPELAPELFETSSTNGKGKKK